MEALAALIVVALFLCGWAAYSENKGVEQAKLIRARREEENKCLDALQAAWAQHPKLHLEQRLELYPEFRSLYTDEDIHRIQDNELAEAKRRAELIRYGIVNRPTGDQ